MVKAVIDKKVYNTKTATEIAEDYNTPDQGNFHYCSETLYRTKKGAYFLFGEGGALSKYAEHFPGGSSGGSEIIPFSDDEAAEWLAEHGFTEKLLECFPDYAEEA